ncbi:hypothetical protein EDB81DRAFT_893546 [Dactylonectria macrodidyma]|uniref:VTC domain-containing protein n=1 Tax=Dactylonectria macrodidyma TaxID=307937 RepID=A0A9P9D6E6_9HYPO|nr:hypothetical protein EDB81DRAFT_893546 [Dactylonectria macrodidyma]
MSRDSSDLMGSWAVTLRRNQPSSEDGEAHFNYTGFLKIVKKHDCKRGDRYKIRPMMQLSLAQRPFNSEQVYSPLLNKLPVMYFATCQQLEDGGEQLPPLDLETQGGTYNGKRYTAHKVEKASEELDGNDSPAITSLYFDNSEFELYSEEVNRQSEASSLRLRWYGQLGLLK